jgi:hypothetical protein
MLPHVRATAPTEDQMVIWQADPITIHQWFKERMIPGDSHRLFRTVQFQKPNRYRGPLTPGGRFLLLPQELLPDRNRSRDRILLLKGQFLLLPPGRLPGLNRSRDRVLPKGQLPPHQAGQLQGLNRSRDRVLPRGQLLPHQAGQLQGLNQSRDLMLLKGQLPLLRADRLTGLNQVREVAVTPGTQHHLNHPAEIKLFSLVQVSE